MLIRRWREAGHLSEKAFAEMQPLWKEAISQAAAPLLRRMVTAEQLGRKSGRGFYDYTQK